MATKGKTQQVTGFTMGRIHFDYTRVVEVGGYKVELVYYYPALEKTVKEMIEAMQQAKPPLTQETFTNKLMGIIANSRYIPLELPQQIREQNPFRLQGKIWYAPLSQFAEELYTKVKAINPMDRGREGNVNQVVFPSGSSVSIGSFGLLCMGIAQTRFSPNGGISGGYSPHKLFEALLNHDGYSARITSTSIQYTKVLGMIEAKQAQQAQAKGKPKGKAKK